MTNTAATAAASTTAAAAADPKPASTNTVTVTLEDPVMRGELAISTVTLRKPIVRDLRGLAINALYTADVDAMAKLLPRITTPTLLAHEIDTMAPADFTALATEVVGFLLSKQDRAALPA